MRKISDASENSLQKINEINFERVRETLDKDKQENSDAPETFLQKIDEKNFGRLRKIFVENKREKFRTRQKKF